jgi:hypothetical protein
MMKTAEGMRENGGIRREEQTPRMKKKKARQKSWAGVFFFAGATSAPRA